MRSSPVMAAQGDGGAIFRDRGTLNITNSIIGGTGAGQPNTATNGGGVAHAFTVDSAAGNTSNQTIVNINGGSINGNIAKQRRRRRLFQRGSVR
jgi:hypothetical protein